MLSRVVQVLFVLIGYLCTATVIAALLGVGYLWRSDRLNDEKMFRLVALMHDIDLHQLSEAERRTDEEVPQAELSLEDLVRRQQVLDRNFEVKMLALQRGRQEYDHRLQQLKAQTERYDRLAQEWQERLRQEEDLAQQENLARIVRDLERVREATAKDLLMRWIEEDRLDEVIELMSRMSESKLAKILKKFETDQELDKLHELHLRVISGEPDKSRLSEALGELKAVQEGGGQ
jgi:GTP1/Obg family GTP-binding protein